MSYIILTNQNFKKLHQDFWDRKFCNCCGGELSCSKCLLTVGTSSVNAQIVYEIDVLLIGKKPAYTKNGKDCIASSDPQYKNYTFDQHVKDFYDYYKTPSPTKTNQKIIKEILTLSNKNNLTWVYTDYLKNQYAIEKCSSIYSNCIVFLILQIFLLKPKVVITFGGNVLKLFLNLFIDMIYKSITISGKVSEDHGKSYKICIDFNKIYRGSFNSSSINL